MLRGPSSWGAARGYVHFLRPRQSRSGAAAAQYHLQAGILDVSGHPAGQQAAILWALSCGVPPTHWGCVAVDITPHHPRHWPERVIFGNQKPSKQIESLGQDVLSIRRCVGFAPRLVN